MSLLRELWQHRRAYWLAFIVYWGIVLFGYDTGVAGSVIAQPYFKQQFGIVGSRANDLSQNIVSVLQAGAFFGALSSPPVSAWIGRRYTLMIYILIFTLGAILQTVATPSIGVGIIYAGRVISGLGVGAISAVAPAYVSECAPKEHRGRITGCFQIMVAIGVMLSYFINFGISLHIKGDARVWRIPFGFQLVPSGILAIGLLSVKESPRFLVTKDKNEQALATLAYYRDRHIDDPAVMSEFAEIEAALLEEREARKGLGTREAFLGKGNFIRFVIAFVIFLLQQFSGQNSVGYYAPQIFASIGYSSTTGQLLASGVYGIMKVAATAVFVFFLVDSLGRKFSLFISAMGMGILFFIVGALLKSFPLPANPPPNPPPASRAMAAMIYIFVCFYSMGWGPLPWVYVSDIFPTRTRHYGLAVASASQWLFNFVISRITLTIETNLGYKMYFMFGAINIGGGAVFSLLIPETKGRSLEEMDVIFGAVDAGKRRADIAQQERVLEHGDVTSERSVDGKDPRGMA
ncbi:general substrate transporter [Vararia minispora EC-137]|uniref:General substrate transporter n=1 Tax=Vararia minispora EC-137 TaxID=1314806 RepID=A0ACB8QI88_9AGAM|nr:general substrate transporter [Vararia minispora EC-137]